jgi:hypothetical protein
MLFARILRGKCFCPLEEVSQRTNEQEITLMSDARQTTIRFAEPLYRRLEVASESTGLPINSIVIAACLAWLQEYEPPLADLRDFPSGTQLPLSEGRKSDPLNPTMKASKNKR